jgi:serine/threonine protein kinase
VTIQDDRSRAAVPGNGQTPCDFGDLPTVALPATGSFAEGSDHREAFSPSALSVVPASVGPYKLLEKLGEGGMGQVWLAEQTTPIRRRVALKLIRGSHYDGASVQRFELERQLLAVMEHPAIAKVFDAGATSEGQPYLVMEYVPGLPITRYCDEHRLILRERLQLFIRVCDGVQHAHQKAIIHRDLKPSNILVREVDGQPAPRIIDFGISKALTPQLSDGTGVTQLGVLVGTPGYMSPEQADPGTRDVDTRTDVYSLGVILYELLAGSIPFETSNLPLHEMLRQLHQDDPPTPSTKISRDAQFLKAAARMRGTSRKHLLQHLRGDLDWITLKALERERERRYDSPSALALDIERYLNNEAVLATPPSSSYLAAKFIRRHRVSVTAAAAVALMLIVLAVSMTVQTVRISRERDRANREAAAAESVADFLAGLFKVSDPNEAQGNSITARQILDQGARKIQTDLRGQPELQARLMGIMGNVYTNLGLLKPARQLLESSLAIRKDVSGPHHPETLARESDLGWLEDRQGEYAPAEALLHDTLQEQQRILGPDHASTLSTTAHLGSVYVHQGRYAKAEALLTDAVAISQRTRGAEDAGTLNLMNTLAVAYDGQHKYAEEERLQRQLVMTKRRVLGSDNPATIVATQNLAYVCIESNQYAEAERLLRDSLESARRVLGPEHPDTLQIVNNLGNLLSRERRYAEAERLHRQTLAIRQRILGPDHPDTLYSINNLGEALAGAGRLDEAERLYREALAKETKVLGEDHPDIGTVWYNLATIEALRGHPQQAIALLYKAASHGYADADSMAADQAWSGLRDDARYQAAVAEIRRRAAGGNTSLS